MDREWLFLLLGLLLGIPFSILANFATPWVKSVYDKGVFSSRVNKIENIIIDYQATKIYKQNPLRYIARILSDIIILMFLFFTLVIIVGLVIINVQREIPTSDLAGELGYAFLLLLVMATFFLSNWRAVSIRKKIFDIFDFDEYRVEVIEKLKNLGLKQDTIDEFLGKD
jgi:hypothetical protein